MKVFILCTVRKPELLPYALLVFKTIRVGFPTAEIFVTGNALKVDISGDIESMCGITGYCDMGVPTIHHEWISELVCGGCTSEPFWICDTDVVFYDKVEDWKFDTAIAGCRVPEWEDKHGNITRSRLHGSLMYIDPVKLRAGYEAFSFPKNTELQKFMPPADPFSPILIPINGRLHFFDTMAVAYHLMGGTAFTDEQRDAYFHFNFGTIPDLTLPLLDNPEEIEKRRAWIMEDPQRGRGLWREGEQYFEDRQVKYDGKDVIAPVSKEDTRDANHWCAELCNGNQSAMAFCDTWYSLCHAWDDCIDLMQDGRPTMSKDQMISEIGFRSAILYNSPFYIANREILFPIILDITSTWRVSVAWERSPLAHRRLIADIFRTSGNRLYYFVALLCAGEQHAQQMILRIHERDFLAQHSADGKPI